MIRPRPKILVVEETDPRLRRLIDRVTVALVPYDAFTGKPVTEGVRAKIKGWPNEPVKNRSGMLVFVNVDLDREAYEIEVDAEAAGYFDPDPINFPKLPEDEDRLPQGRPQERRRDVPLIRLPGHNISEDETTVAGVVVRKEGDAKIGVAGVAVIAMPVADDAESGATFETLTDARGGFSLPIRLPRPQKDDGTVDVIFTFQKDNEEHKLERPMTEGFFHSFKKPIDFEDLSDSADANTPLLLRFGMSEDAQTTEDS